MISTDSSLLSTKNLENLLQEQWPLPISLFPSKPGRCTRTIFGKLEMRNNHFKLCDSIVAIRLDEFTKMDEVTIVANLIPSEIFRFRSVDQLMALANTNVELPGLESTVCVSVYDSLAEILHMRLEAGVVHLKVMVATNINPKFMGGE
ncbi:hypothetical protein YC2023_102450 [Brassica napus]